MGSLIYLCMFLWVNILVEIETNRRELWIDVEDERRKGFKIRGRRKRRSRVPQQGFRLGRPPCRRREPPLFCPPLSVSYSIVFFFFFFFPTRFRRLETLSHPPFLWQVLQGFTSSHFIYMYISVYIRDTVRSIVEIDPIHCIFNFWSCFFNCSSFILWLKFECLL